MLEVLPDELDAEGFAATPHHFATPPGSGVTRESEPQAAGQHAGIILDRDLRAGARQILHHALARGEAAIEGDPAGLVERFARFALLVGCGHFLLSIDTSVGTSLPRRALKTVAKPWKYTPLCRRGPVHLAGKTGFRAACPAAQTPLYVRPSQLDQFATIRLRHGAIAASTR
jgi:hypothetical protein